MESLNSHNSLRPEQSNCPFYSIAPPDNMANTQAPLLKSAAEPQPEVQIPESHQDQTHSDWVVEPNSEQQILLDTEFKQLLALNEELRESNNQLYEEVEHLKDHLAESEKALQWQKRRSSVAESMLNQQTQELAAAQEQIKSLFQELETSVQTVQRQENFIETYKTQLQISQQRLAQLERECALVQTNYNEQSQQALQSENTCRELRSRLMRQQRQTLQFKAALEKCLDTPAPDESSEDTANHQTRFSRKARSLFPNVQPIRPWSGESEGDSCQVDSAWGQYSPSSVCNPDPSEPISSSSENLPVEENTLPLSEAVSQEMEISATTSEMGSSNLDVQLDSLIQMFFTSNPESTSPISAETEDANPEDDQQLPIMTTEKDSPNEMNANSYLDEATAGENVQGSGNPQMYETDVIADPFEDYSHNDPSPSPVVYPDRPPKGRKSLSSVELPNFRIGNQSQNPQ
ncbi:hypothetical protein VB620_01335 [Nodularia harveyana UHCC-0300]|uniref:Uncharacterized protein n=1 Tax=Nodularia harveyana UHCC-0300 TaxID=2974287 RepID=A0ABU5U8X9_9CYAN|nr:hypothetical protein [Nodularia harveyana]MEA5579980.1 hypothetical protein [Nodularia harveyana UHCC-0300]